MYAHISIMFRLHAAAVLDGFSLALSIIDSLSHDMQDLILITFNRLKSGRSHDLININWTGIYSLGTKAIFSVSKRQ